MTKSIKNLLHDLHLHLNNKNAKMYFNIN